MKTKQEKKGGVALILLAIIATLPFLIGSYASYSLNNQRITQKAIHYMRARIIAENILRAGGESFYMLLKKDPTTRPTKLQTDLNNTGFLDDILAISLTADAKKSGFTAPIISFKNTRIGRSNLVSVVVGVDNKLTDIKFALKTDYNVEELPFLDYAIFTDGIFEISAYPSMDIHGDVRSNDKIRIGGPGNSRYLSFYDKLWTAQDIEVFNGWSGSTITAAKRMKARTDSGTWENFLSSYNGAQVPLDSSHPNWSLESQARWGTDRIKDGMSALELPIDSSDNHLLIEPAIEAGSDKDDVMLQREKFAWKAKRPGGLRIKVDHSGNVSYSEGGAPFVGTRFRRDIAYPFTKDSSTGVYDIRNPAKTWKAGKGWINVDDSYVDRRESGSTPVRVVNLYMDNLIKKFPNVNLVYVEVEDNKGTTTPYLEAKKSDSSTALATVRIRNGNDISAAKNGLTVATHRMAYVEGNFNVKDKVSALIACDNLTMLSNAWDENTSKTTKTDATETWLQAALLIGGYSYRKDRASSPINGLHNLVRFLENWHDHIPYHFLGSYVKLFNGKESLCKSSSRYFNAPFRDVAYDNDFIANPPPGMPTSLGQPDTLLWSEITWDEAKRLAGIN